MYVFVCMLMNVYVCICRHTVWSAGKRTIRKRKGAIKEERREEVDTATASAPVPAPAPSPTMSMHIRVYVCVHACSICMAACLYRCF